MALLRKLTVASLAALIAAEEPRQLGFDLGSITMDTNGVSNDPFSQMKSMGSSFMNQAASQMSVPSAASVASPISDPFASPGFSDNPFSSFGNAAPTPAPSANNGGLGGPPLSSPQTGSDILQGMIKSFLANKKLQPGEEQCLEQGCGALGSQVTSVTEAIVTVGQQMISMKNGGQPAAPAASADMSSMFQEMSGGASAFGAPPAAAAPVAIPAPAPVVAPKPVAKVETPEDAFAMFGFAQGARRLQDPFGMSMPDGGGGGGGMSPVAMMGGMAMAMQLGKQMESLADLGHQVMSKCLQGDGKDTLHQAALNARNPAYLTKSLSSNGADAFGDLADAMDMWKSGNAEEFGGQIGSALREVFLDTDTTGKLPEGLPNKATLMNVTGGMLQGFFGPGSTVDIKTPDIPGGFTIDLHKCLGNNVGLLQSMWASTFHYMAKSAGSTSLTEPTASSSSGSQSQATLLAYTMMQIPAALKQCNIGSEQEQALKDAIGGLGKGSSFKFDLPDGDMSKTEAVKSMASAVGGYQALIQNPQTAGTFGQSLGATLQKTVESVFENKYYVDKSGRLRKRLLQLDATVGGVGGVTSMVTPVLMVSTVVLLGLALIAVKNRRGLQADEEMFMDLEEADDAAAPEAAE